ncbi:hypothetical protein Poli38472_010981 [Pythium oligandrum]|uniref:HSF-type DNA-binding domain-containing protein n=1 Tax=Pythium oligandrum TaxID=41045 RepID=A0A8K1FKP5_PYTOL|nr:hypothetical protein Poli38472_010981 [Pythium oligandrum]|eukprot:TMW61918.1 hypothetical protein Poli38472_010981 [Pythium oligandrum]
MTKATRELAPFLRQLWDILEHESPDVIRWTDGGRAFEIHNLQKVIDTVLPKYFKHRRYASFQRQLNYFNFRKWTKSRTAVSTFSNPYFVREAPELMWHIVRKRDLNRSRRDLAPIAIQSPKELPEDVLHSPQDSTQDPSGLFAWIDAEFPSLASLEQLEKDPVAVPSLLGFDLSVVPAS